jgi:hypothetical protein
LIFSLYRAEKVRYCLTTLKRAAINITIHTTMKIETAIFTAATLGTIAFNQGRTSVPIHDPAFYKLIKEHAWDGSMTPVLKAWVSSWHAANAAAKV